MLGRTLVILGGSCWLGSAIRFSRRLLPVDHRSLSLLLLKKEMMRVEAAGTRVLGGFPGAVPLPAALENTTTSGTRRTKTRWYHPRAQLPSRATLNISRLGVYLEPKYEFQNPTNVASAIELSSHSQIRR